MKDNQAKYPQLRFKGFTNPWEKRKLGKWFAERTERSGEGEMLSVTISSGVVRANSLDRKDNSSTDKSNYKVVHIGDIAYNSMRMWQAASGVSNYGGIVSPAYTVLVPAAEVSSVFFGYQFKQTKMKQIFQRNSQGLTSDTWNLKYPLLAKIKTSAPQKTEQVKIGTFFATLDHLIAVNQRKLAKLKELKQGYLQKMFPKNGAKVPELRFAGFADDWEQCKLGGILAERNDQITETNEYPLMSFVQGKGVTPKGKRYNRSFLVKDVDKKYKKTELGDFIYSSNNLETGSIGFNRTGKAVISPVYSIFKSKREQESQFIGIMSARKDFIFKMIRFRQGVVYGQWRIHESDFLNIDIRIPSYEEQQSIICFFEKLNKAITLHQRKLEKLQELKKGYLQKMFC